MQRRVMTAALLGIGAFVGTALGQTEASARPGGGFRVPAPHPIVHAMTAENRPDLRYHAAETQLNTGAFDPLAEPLVRSSERFSNAIFSLRHLALQRAITYTAEDEDRFVAEWRFVATVGTGSLILDDRPDRSSYYFRLTGCALGTADDVNRLIANLLVLNKPPANVVLARSATKLYGDAGSFLSFSWAFDPEFPSPQPFLRDLWVMGTTDGKDCFLTVSVGKLLTLHYYPIQPYIPERFPPLTDRVKDWTAGRIRSELSKPAGPNLPGNRAEILLTELVRRGLPAQEIVELLREAAPGGEATRLQHILAAMKRSSNGLDIMAYFGPAIQIYAGLGPRGEDAADLLFLEAAKKCAPEAEATALQFLRAGVLLRGSLEYVSSCSSSHEALQTLEALPVAESLERLKAQIIRVVRRRGADTRKM